MVMESKSMPNRQRYMEALRRMSPEQRLAKAFELSEMSNDAARAGIEQMYPQATDRERHALLIERLERCRSRNC